MPVASLTPLQAAMLGWLFVLGCIVGSFLNVCIWRLPRGDTIGRPRRSYCPLCGRALRWHDNVPLVSFLLLHGRCRDCGGRISARYPVIELITGLLFPLVYYRQGILAGADVGQLVVMMLVLALLVIAAAVDVEFLIIPDEVSIFGILGGLAAGLLLPGLHVGPASYHTFEPLTGSANVDGVIGAAIGVLGGGGVVLLFAVVGYAIFQREAMGFGDVKLMAMVGAFFGWKVVVVAFFLAPFVGLLYGLPLLLTRDEHVMPYGPFLALASGVAILFRETLCGYPELLEHLWGMLVG